MQKRKSSKKKSVPTLAALIAMVITFLNLVLFSALLDWEKKPIDRYRRATLELIKGEDDNAGKQLKASKQLNQIYMNERKKNASTPVPTATAGLAQPPWIQKYTTVTCACSRLNRYQHNSPSPHTLVPVYIHIPKTGGTTIEHQMSLAGSCHATRPQYLKCNNQSPPNIPSIWTFTALRHPIDRAISLYRYCKQGGNGSPMDKQTFGWVTNLDFDAFVDGLPTYMSMVMFQTQTYFISMSSSFNNVNNNNNTLLDKILCTDRLVDMWNADGRLVSSFGKIPAKKRLRASSPKLQMSYNNITRATISKESVTKLQTLFKDDFLLWKDHCGNDSSINNRYNSNSTGGNTSMVLEPLLSSTVTSPAKPSKPR